MKTIKLKYLATGLVLLLGLGSCNDDLNRFPQDSIEQSQAFQTIRDAEAWNNGMYAQFRNRVYGYFMYATDIQSDLLNAGRDYGNRSGALHRWDDTFLSDNGTLMNTWALFYSGITDLNVAIEGFETIETESPEEQALLERMQAENYLARAYYYHELVTRYAEDYDPATASSDLGVPLMLEYDINNFPSRNTVEEVYQQILSDIGNARSGLADVPGSQGAQRFNIDVVDALEARVRLHMEDWSRAKELADGLIETGTYPLITDQEQFIAMWEMDDPQEVIMQMFVSAPNELARANDVYLGFNAETEMFTPDWIPTQWIVDLYQEEDIREAAYFEELPVRVAGVDYEGIELVNKYPGNPDLFTGAATNYQHAPKVFRIAEMYLISAEAGARGAGDGATPLNALRTARGVEAVDVSGDALLEVVKEERTRELAFEGFRLDDLKRWDEGLNPRTPQNEGPVVPGSEFTDIVIEAGHPKFIWGIPSRDIIINPNLEGQQNPGWE